MAIAQPTKVCSRVARTILCYMALGSGLALPPPRAEAAQGIG